MSDNLSAATIPSNNNKEPSPRNSIHSRGVVDTHRGNEAGN